MVSKVNLAEKFAMIEALWSPRIAAELNDSYVKLARLKGEFMWHHHETEDELFFVLKGELVIRLRETEIRLGEGELVVIPKGVEHMPVAENEVQVMLIEPKSTVNTGTLRNERTKEDQWI